MASPYRITGTRASSGEPISRAKGGRGIIGSMPHPPDAHPNPTVPGPTQGGGNIGNAGNAGGLRGSGLNADGIEVKPPKKPIQRGRKG